MIRSYFYKLDIPPTARIGNEAEMALLKQEVLENLLKEAYEHNEYGIFDLSDFFSDDKSDAGLQDKVLSLYEFAMSQSNPDGWMRHAVEPYKAAQEQDLRDTLWGRAMWDDQQAEIDRIADRIEQMEPLLESPVGPKKWDKVYQEQLAALAQLKGAQTWSDMVDVCRNLDTFTKANFTSLSKALEKGEVDGALADEFKSLGSQNKDSLKGMKNGLFHIDESVLQQQFKDQYPLIHNLVELTIAFHKAYDEAKKEQGIMDFSDLEHLCLALLVEPGTEDDPQPSEVALELQDTFKEIMVDEYQDTNGVQETIINLISRVDNRFYVGDVKQAIYSFRMADSSLFMNKYNTYGLMNDAVERRIDLAKNFRSHENILTTTNFIFYQIMTQEAAELDYGEKESLIPGRIVEDAPSDWVGGAVELHLLDTSDTNRSDETEGDSETAGDEPENNERELDFIIQKIKELHASKKQVQNADGSFRQIQWRDFAVLRRSLAGWGTRAVAAMRQAGIPAVVNERDGYFEAQEIQLLLSLLQIIDNPEQDLPMAAVLHSGLVGLDANELGALRLTGDGSLWSVMPLYAEQAQDEHLLQFIAHIERWRTLSRRHGVADLLWDIYETLDYVNYVGAMPNGLVRRANVMALYERAKGFESSGFRGLFRFLRFVESLRDSNQDMAVANVVTEADDVVRLMTIHKSKGLEFPVVFLSGVQKKFNTMDFNSPLLVDKNGGIGLKGYYPDIRVSYPSMPWLYCKSIKSDAMKAEEQRILYVALTRARDKLFLTGYINKEIKKEKGVGAHIKHAALTQTQALGADLIKAGNSYLHWLLIAFARHLDGGASLRNIIELEGETNFDLLDRQCQVKVEIHDGSLYGDLDYKADVDETTINTVRVLGKVNDVALPEEIVQRFAFTYPNLVAAKTTAKISVSELKRRFAERDAEAVSATDVSMQQKPVISCNITEDTTGENAILDTSIPTINETELADSVFGRKPLAIAAADEVVTGAQWGH